jgi:hypothetical protein
MATSGSANFSVSGGDIVRAAYRIVYSSSSDYTLTGSELSDGLESLNFLVKNLMGPPSFLARGMKTWQRETASLTLAAKIEYSFKTSGGDLNINIPVKILNANYKTGNNETPLTQMSNLEYERIGNKTNTGTPTRYNFERRLTDAKFRLDIVPTASIVSNGDTIEISYLKPLEDFDSTSDDPYFPQEWFRPLKWLLAVEMMPEAGRLVPADVAALATQATEAANALPDQEQRYSFEPDNPELYNA